jgi:leucyl-tRNA synthetase
MDIRMDYQPDQIEKKWQRYWQENKTYQVEIDHHKPKYYILDMFPYPSGAGLHVGHPLGYFATDIFSRYKRMKGFNVLHPMGFDAFGLPAEQYAIQTGVHPAISTAENIQRYRQQMSNLGFDYDWSREVQTCDPDYYKWTQWIFLQLFNHYYDKRQNKAWPVEYLIEQFELNGNLDVEAVHAEEILFDADEWVAMLPKEKDEVLMNYRLAYKKIAYVNWCEALGTVLANDEVKDGVSERGGYPVEKRAMDQWALRITAYAGRLLDDLEGLAWPEPLKAMQRNWIGRSEGASVHFPLDGHDMQLEIYTTRPDTLFGVTFMVLAPEHDWVDALTTDEQRGEVEEYLKYVASRSDRERISEVKKVTGAFTGSYAVHPFTREKLPVWISEYVLKDYGSGAIMAVPSDDLRDKAFAEKFDLPIIEVVDRSQHPGAGPEDKVGTLINSGPLDGMQVPEAIKHIIEQLQDKELGRRQVNYKLRDANFSRQRYWGEPFPIVYDRHGVSRFLEYEDLPLELPELDNFQPTSEGRSPLARAKSWVELPGKLKRETDTMPGYAGSSWYFLRYMDPDNEDALASREALDYWQDVDFYVGGTEHAVGHLLYARFWHKFLHDLGIVPTVEPFKKLINQGMIQGTIEFLYLHRAEGDEPNRFVCAKIAEERGLDAFTQIPVHIDFVTDYGSPQSFMDGAGIEKFLAWRPEFEGAVFETEQGVFSAGDFHEKRKTQDVRLYTHSVVGKMSKSKYNVINPDEVVAKYGADCFRMYEMFLGPIEQAKPWDTKGIDGVSKFLKRFWGLFYDEAGKWAVSDAAPDREEWKILHHTIKRVEEDLERFSLNTCVSTFMICLNELRKFSRIKREIADPLVRLLAPFAPHITEELWRGLGHSESVHLADYPELDESYLVEDSISYPVSVNGKKRAMVDIAADASVKQIETAALSLPEIEKWIDGQQVKKVIVVPKRMVNIVV